MGKEFTAAEKVANSPELEVPARTTFAPAGGLVRAAEVILKRERQKIMQANTNVIFFGLLPLDHHFECMLYALPRPKSTALNIPYPEPIAAIAVSWESTFGLLTARPLDLQPPTRSGESMIILYF